MATWRLCLLGERPYPKHGYSKQLAFDASKRVGIRAGVCRAPLHCRDLLLLTPTIAFAHGMDAWVPNVSAHSQASGRRKARIKRDDTNATLRQHVVLEPGSRPPVVLRETSRHLEWSSFRTSDSGTDSQMAYCAFSFMYDGVRREAARCSRQQSTFAIPSNSTCGAFTTRTVV